MPIEELDAANTAEEPQNTEEEVVKKAEPCYRCGYSDAAEPEPLEEDLEEYLRCILGGKEFHKEYELYNGKIKLEFRSINNRQVDKLNSVAFKLNDHMDSKEIQDRSIKLKLLYFLARVKLGDLETEYDIPLDITFDTIMPEFEARFGDCSETVIRAMTNALLLFMDLQGLLVSQGFDANFWKGAGLRSR